MTAVLTFLTQPPVTTQELRDALSIILCGLAAAIALGVVVTLANPEKHR